MIRPRRRFRPYHPDLPEIRADWAVYYDRVTDVDAEIGEFLKQLEEDGLVEDTIVIYYSDHGGALARSKRFLFESGLRVPLIVHVPKKWRDMVPRPAGSGHRPNCYFCGPPSDGPEPRRSGNSRTYAGASFPR